RDAAGIEHNLVSAHLHRLHRELRVFLELLHDPADVLAYRLPLVDLESHAGPVDHIERPRQPVLVPHDQWRPGTVDPLRDVAPFRGCESPILYREVHISETDVEVPEALDERRQAEEVVLDLE